MKTTKAASDGLNRSLIIDRAVAVADSEGLEAVSIRRLGQEFGVTPMALYWHVQNKDDLLAAMGDRLFADLELPDPAGSWSERLHALMVVLVDGLRRHPTLLPLAFARVLASADGLALTEAALTILDDAGFDSREAANIAAHALRTAVGLIADQPGTEHGLPDPDRDETLKLKRSYLNGLDPAQFPHLLAAADDLLACDDQGEYDQLGIDLFIAGVRSLAKRGTPGRSLSERGAQSRL